MTTHYDADVAVIGYGPTALITTLTLAKQGASVIAFEKEKSIYPRARAVTVNDWTVRIFQDLGIADRILKVIEAQRGLRWLTYDGTEIMRVMHPESTLGHNVRFYNIYQPTMEAELRAAGEEMYGDRITVHYGDEVTGLEQDEDGVTVTSTTPDGGTRTVRAKYVVGADGGKSFTRRHIGTTMIGDAMPSLWIVVDCFSKRWWPDRDFLTFWSDKERPVVDIALSAGAHRWELTLKPTESEADYQTEDQVWPLLEAIGHNKDDMTIHQWAFYYHAAQIGDHWRQGRIFLAGDACHLTRPFAGAGMQTGMRDGHNLGWKLGRVISGELDPAWLDTYEAERKPNAKYFIDLAVVLGKVIEQTATPQEMSWLNDPDPSFVVTPWEPALNRPPVLEAGWFRGPVATDASAVGRMIPQPTVCDALGHIALVDDLLGDGFVLLGANVNPASTLTPEQKQGWDAMKAKYIAIRPQNAYSEDISDIIDLDGKILAWMERYGVKVIAVRPDKFVAAADVSGIGVPEL